MVSLMRLMLNWNDDDDAAADDNLPPRRTTTGATAIEIRIWRHQRGNVDDDSDAGADATMSKPTTMLLRPILSPTERVVRAAGHDYTC
jgi:hypothetical protein